MSNSDSDSDGPANIHELGLPTINNEQDGTPVEGNEESKDKVAHDGKDGSEDPEKEKKFNKFRDQAKDLISKTEKPKQLYLSNAKITKMGDESTTSESSSAKPKHLEINDPRFNYDVILSKGYKLIKKMGNGAYASVFL